jgi:AcrR family transcriptional regulator
VPNFFSFIDDSPSCQWGNGLAPNLCPSLFYGPVRGPLGSHHEGDRANDQEVERIVLYLLLSEVGVSYVLSSIHQQALSNTRASFHISPAETASSAMGAHSPTASAPRKLKPGPGLTVDEVQADQRRRLHAAVIGLVAQDGWGSIRMRSLIRVARVSSASFYESFASADECLASALDEAVTKVVRPSTSAQHEGDDWCSSIEAATTTLANEIAGHPEASRVAFVEVFAAGTITRRLIPNLFAELQSVLGLSFKTAPDSPPISRHLLAGMTAGLLRVVRQTILAGRTRDLPLVAKHLTVWLSSLPAPEVASLLGRPPEVARREPKPLPDEPGLRAQAVIGDRECLLKAASRLAASDGYGSLTPQRIRAAAGVSRRRFEENFSGSDECFLGSVQLMAGECAARADEWSSDTDEWARRTCRMILAITAQIARDPRHARLAFIDVYGPGDAGLLCREGLVSEAAEKFHLAVPKDRRPSRLSSEASVAAAWQIAQSTVAAGRAHDLPTVAPLLGYIFLAPVIGSREAARTALEESGWS